MTKYNYNKWVFETQSNLTYTKDKVKEYDKEASEN